MNEIFAVIDALKRAREAEADFIVVLADARANVEKAKAICLAEAYQAGRVDGKNEQARKVQEAQLLADAVAVREAEVLERQIATKHTAARIEVDYLREKYAAMLALVKVEAEGVWPMPGG